MNDMKPGLSAAEFALEPVRWLPGLLAALEEQAALCEGLDALSVQQTSAVGAGDTDRLLRILNDRQRIVDRVGVINRGLEHFRSQRRAILDRLGAAERGRVEELIGRISALVERVQERDEADRKQLEKQRFSVMQEMSGLSRGRGAMSAYAAQGAGAAGRAQPKFQDRQV